MLTLTIGQISAAASISTADKLELEQSGVSKTVTVAQLQTTLVTNNIATTAQSLLATSNTTLMSPLQVREAFNASNDAPVYACRAWCNFNGTTTTSSLSGTYTRVVGTTLTVCVATAHGMITGNVQYIDFVTGGGSDNSYIVTVTDSDTFAVNTVSTSSILSSTLSLKRCPLRASGNISNVSRNSTGSYHVNFAVGLPSDYYGISGCGGDTDTALRAVMQNITDSVPTKQSCKIQTSNVTGSLSDIPFVSVQVFA
jgi:hypothetical protein